MARKENHAGVTNQSYQHSEEIDFPSNHYQYSEGKRHENVSKFNKASEADWSHGDGMRPIASMSNEEIRSERIKIWKNVIIISFAFMCLFTAFNSMANLQSSINSVSGLGTGSLSTLYAAIVLSSMFVPTWMIKTIKCKWTLVLCQLCYSAYIAAQFYPSFPTLIPGAIILGFGAAPMWAAKCTYLTQVGNRYASLTGQSSPEVSISRFFGIFFMFFQMSQIWGNMISSMVLSGGSTENNTITEDQLQFCGANFCHEETGNATALEKPSSEKIYMLAGIFLGFAVLASVIIAIFVDPLTQFGELAREGSSSGKSGKQLLVATFKHMQNPYQMLIIPLTLWSGFEQAFIGADFTAAFISCSWGIQNVGFVMICYGVADAIASITSGVAIKRLGRVPIFVFGAVVNLTLLVTFLYWRPDPNQPAVYFVIAALWGTADAIWQTQINAFYGVIFSSNEEAAFSNYRLWESFGFIIAYAYSTAICVHVKIYILFFMLVIGIVGYLTIEYVESKKLNKNPTEKKP